jgi:hypothetical protein
MAHGALGMQRLIASCLNDACRHTALIDVSSYPAESEGAIIRPPRRLRCMPIDIGGSQSNLQLCWRLLA